MWEEWIKASSWWNTWMNLQWIYVIWIFVHPWNPIYVWQIYLIVTCLYSKWSEDRRMVVQHFWCRKIREIVHAFACCWSLDAYESLHQSIHNYLENRCWIFGNNLLSTNRSTEACVNHSLTRHSPQWIYFAYTVPREWVKSKFLCRDADVMSHEDKCIVVGCFVCGECDKILMETGKF